MKAKLTQDPNTGKWKFELTTAEKTASGGNYQTRGDANKALRREIASHF